jgi:hypothetical protein
MSVASASVPDTEPPGLSMCSMIAETFGSATALRRSRRSWTVDVDRPSDDWPFISTPDARSRATDLPFAAGTISSVERTSLRACICSATWAARSIRDTRSHKPAPAWLSIAHGPK